jgi:hypothetical protein
MATERSQHQAWAESQVQALVDLGVDILDAQRSVDWILDNLPFDADPATYVFPADALWQEPSSDASVDDARADWMAKDEVPAKFKRLLEARAEDGE